MFYCSEHTFWQQALFTRSWAQGGGGAGTDTEALLRANVQDLTESPHPPVRQGAAILRRTRSPKDAVFF